MPNLHYLNFINSSIFLANLRSQLQNKEMAMRMLKGKLLELQERERMEQMANIKGEMKKIEWGRWPTSRAK